MSKKYKIFSADTETELVDKISNALEDGWQLCGDLVVTAIHEFISGNQPKITYKYFREMVLDDGIKSKNFL